MDAPVLYAYHPETGLPVGQVTADPSPLEPGEWLFPAFATLAAPPSPGGGQVARFVDGAWVIEDVPAPEPVPEPPPPDLVAHAADRRWQKEVGGIIVAGIPVATDDRSKLMITGARLAAMADPAWTTVWHGSDGGTYPLNVAAMVAISDAVQAHVNGTFETFASVKAAIEAGTVTDKAGVDAAFGDGG